MHTKLLLLVAVVCFSLTLDTKTMEQEEVQQASCLCDGCGKDFQDLPICMVNCDSDHCFCNSCYDDMVRLGVACVVCNNKKAQKAEYKKCNFCRKYYPNVVQAVGPSKQTCICCQP